MKMNLLLPCKTIHIQYKFVKVIFYVTFIHHHTRIFIKINSPSIANRSQLLYSSDSFVGIIENCKYSTKTVRYHFYNMRNHVFICMTCCMITSFKIQRFPVQTTKLQYSMLLLKRLRNQSLVIFV
jgi:hypothetical protein